jgi:glucose-1-phosphate cytidylyltransferase
VDTGESTQTGGRLKRVKSFVQDEPEFCFTYGDGVSDVDIGATFAFHRKHGKLATVTAVQPPGRYGALLTNGYSVEAFVEKPRGDGGLINGGFFILSPTVLDYIEGDATAFESTPLETLAKNGHLMSYQHHGFWQPMDTLREKTQLEDLWASGKAPWKVW